MKSLKLIKKVTAISFAITCLLTYANAFETPNISTMESGLDDFANTLNEVLPNSATQQNVWADAWIGKIFPAVIPHFGGGLNVGITKMDTEGLKTAGKELGISNIPSNLYFPTLNADIRVGGVLLPFDVGFNFTKLDTSSLGFLENAIDPITFDFLSMGFDVRYAILKGGLITPTLSIGAGYTYTKGNFGASDKNASLDFDMTAQTMYLQAQLSKQLLMLTPFVGARGVFSKTEANWDWSVNTGYNSYLSGLGLSTSGSGGKSNNYNLTELQPQLFGGIGLNLLLLDITVSACYDLKNEIPSGAISLRASL